MRWKRFIYFFPFRLLLLHFKKNHFLLLLWFLLFGLTTGMFAPRFGVQQQMLLPEYRGHTGWLSFLIVGFALGGFISAFNLYTYIMHGYRFSFIATLNRPFQKFSINNFIIPAVFILTYASYSARYQYIHELIAPGQIAINILSLLAGIGLFLAISNIYFRYTNKEAHAYGKARRRKQSPRTDDSLADSTLFSPFRWLRRRKGGVSWHVETYLTSFVHISLARESSHYPKDVLDKVLTQNHINASRFELVLVISFLVIGSLRHHEYFVIPAAASTLLFLTMMLMITSALFSWIRGWTLTVLIMLFILLNIFYNQLRLISYESHAYGMNYKTARAEYNTSVVPDAATIESDRQAALHMLENWKKKVAASGIEKPRLVIINCSGGGLRSAYWTMKSLMHADEQTGGALLEHCVLITGASGGMLGASYLREIMWREKLSEPISRHDTLWCEDMAKDLLNPIMLSLATNDWFIRYQRVHDGPYSYTKDRGYSFEQQLHANTLGRLQHRLRDYAAPEQSAQIPMMVLSPTIVNDGRRLLIASQGVSYLAVPNMPQEVAHAHAEDIEFSRLFAAQDAQNLHYSTALRMNSTFPYVLPIVSMPSEPVLEIMDAGIRDNFGLKTTMQFIFSFREWLEQNTSGVVILQVRDLPKNRDIETDPKSLLSDFFAPVGSIYGNMTKTHNYNNEQMLKYLDAALDTEVDLLTFQLPHDEKNFVSLSWHLTQSEKNVIRHSLRNDTYLKEVLALDSLLKH